MGVLFFLSLSSRRPFVLPGAKEWRGATSVGAGLPGGLLSVSSGQYGPGALAEVRMGG